MTPEQVQKVITILELNYCGMDSAAPIDEIVDVLVEEGIKTSRRHFQLKLKPLLLDQGKVLGACSRGMFLCCDPTDYGAALRWYEVRIASEMENLGKIVNALVKFTS